MATPYDAFILNTLAQREPSAGEEVGKFATGLSNIVLKYKAPQVQGSRHVAACRRSESQAGVQQVAT